MVCKTPRAAFLLVLLSVAPAALAQQVTLLDFSLAACTPCRRMDPVVARLESEGVRVQRIDGQRQPDLAARFRVDQYPTFVVLSGDREVKRVVGETPYESLRQMLASAAPQPIGPDRAVARAPQAGRPTGLAAQPAAMLQAAANRTPGIDVPGGARATQPAPTASADLLLNATVRLTVQDASGHSYGTGTVVDARQGEALVLTCAHLFRGEDGQQIAKPGAVSAELYESSGGRPRVAQRVAVERILGCNFDSDVALVSIRPGGAVSPARIAADADSLRQGDPVLSSGCDHGDDPTVRTGVVTALNRYQGPPNITASGAPVVGRSGGGLFSAKGEVVGVCNAADYQDDEGIYAALAAIHAELDKLDLSAIYRGGALAVAADEPAPDALAAIEPPPQTMAPLNGPVVRAQGRDSLDTLAPLSTGEQSALREIIRRAADSEVVCVIRPKSGEGRSEVLTLQSVSPEFVRALLAAYHTQSPPADGL